MKESKIEKVFWMLLLVFILALGLETQVWADSTTILDVLNDGDESVDTEEDYAENTVYSLLRGSDLNYGTVGIRKLSGNQVNVNGLTQCHNVCDKVYVSIYLERKVNGVYSTYKYWEFSTSKATYIDKSINVIVPSGYYYRVNGYHATSNDGRKESISSWSNGIWVSN